VLGSSLSRGVPGSLVGDGFAVPSTHLVLAAFGFLIALGVTLAAAALFADRLDRLGTRMGFTEALLGVLTAIAADSPELASSVAAILRGERDVGLGVVIGSNAFNLAAMVGVGAIVAGSVRPRRSSLVIEATVALALLGVTAALLLAGLPPLAALALVLVVVIPYISILVLGDVRLLPLPAGAHAALRDALGGGFSHPRRLRHAGSWWQAVALMALALAAIIAGATAMVETSLVIADAIRLSHALVGLLLLAVVTSLPNMSTALRLARQGRGDATVSETLNSNNINLVGGIVLPAAILGLGTLPGGTSSDLLWLALLTAGTLLALAPRGGMTRLAGIALVGGYVAFVVAHFI
jgi:cation:H+ antiporter